MSIRSKKSLGQHFLRDEVALARIADAARLSPTDTVLEVGPGGGALTALLLERAEKVIAVEKDARLIPFLRERFAKEISNGTLELIHQDILHFNPIALNAQRYTLAANLPYYITGAFLKKFLQSDHQPSSMTLLLQKEVAHRIVAAGGKESILSISVKCYGTPRIIATVKAGAFYPPPKVDSAILTIEHISKEFFGTFNSADIQTSPQPPLPPLRRAGKGGAWVNPPPTPSFSKGGGEGEDRFFSLLKRGFAHPRKLLASNLGVVPEQLEQCGIAKNARAENVSLAQWGLLTQTFRYKS